MSEEIKNPLDGLVFDTKDIPTLYINHASPSLSYNDIRIYLGEVGPKQMAAVVTSQAKRTEASITPRVCVIVSPEFAKALGESLQAAVQKYESVFGPLRSAPSQEEVNQKLSQ
jgi:hypothetical protein